MRLTELQIYTILCYALIILITVIFTSRIFESDTPPLPDRKPTMLKPIKISQPWPYCDPHVWNYTYRSTKHLTTE